MPRITATSTAAAAPLIPAHHRIRSLGIASPGRIPGRMSGRHRFAHPNLNAMMTTVTDHPLLEQLDNTLRAHVPVERVECSGEWTEALRRTYTSELQAGSGAGPYSAVVDRRWRGTLASPDPIGGMAFLATGKDVHWVKAPEISHALPVDVSLHAYAIAKPDRATFTASLAGAYLPGIPVHFQSAFSKACLVQPGSVSSGRLSCLARADTAAFFVLLLPRSVLEVGRKRLWRVRDEISASLPPPLRELLTRRRAGTIPLASPSPQDPATR